MLCHKQRCEAIAHPFLFLLASFAGLRLLLLFTLTPLLCLVWAVLPMSLESQSSSECLSGLGQAGRISDGLGL